METVAAKSSEAAASIGGPAGGGATLEESIGLWLKSAKEGAEIDVHARAFEAMERVLFGRAIDLAQGNQARAARWLNVSRQTMREKLRSFGLKDEGQV